MECRPHHPARLTQIPAARPLPQFDASKLLGVVTPADPHPKDGEPRADLSGADAPSLDAERGQEHRPPRQEHAEADDLERDQENAQEPLEFLQELHHEHGHDAIPEEVQEGDGAEGREAEGASSDEVEPIPIRPGLDPAVRRRIRDVPLGSDDLDPHRFLHGPLGPMLDGPIGHQCLEVPMEPIGQPQPLHRLDALAVPDGFAQRLDHQPVLGPAMLVIDDPRVMGDPADLMERNMPLPERDEGSRSVLQAIRPDPEALGTEEQPGQRESHEQPRGPERQGEDDVLGRRLAGDRSHQEDTRDGPAGQPQQQEARGDVGAGPPTQHQVVADLLDMDSTFQRPGDFHDFARQYIRSVARIIPRLGVVDETPGQAMFDATEPGQAEGQRAGDEDDRGSPVGLKPIGCRSKGWGPSGSGAGRAAAGREHRRPG